MPELHDIGGMLARAEKAAAAGEFVTADELLQDVARIQEEQLGPIHPDLANTLNNRAILAEKTGRPDEAETFYRRAVAIASASLPADDPMLAASRKNLEDFCRARGLPVEVPAQPPPTRVEARDRRPASSTAVMAIGVVLLVIAALFFMRPRSSGDFAAAAPTASSTRAEPTAPSMEPTKEPAVVERVEPPKPTKPAAAARSQRGVSLADVELCSSFSPRGENWKCVPAGNTVAPAQLALYTRVKSPRNAVVVHRWYRGNELRQAVKLQVRASATEGYRTFSRQTVHAGETWRVEVRSPSDELLYEQRVTVR